MIFLGLFIVAGGILLGGLLHGFTVPRLVGGQVRAACRARLEAVYVVEVTSL